MLMLGVVLFVLGTVAGSFASAVSWRIHKKMDWVKDRSRCPHCNHVLEPVDLVPIFSWLSLKGRCRYCRKRISGIYPVVELAGGIVFASSYWLWPGGLRTSANKFDLAVWLISAVFLLVLFIYDLRWYLLPNRLVYPLIAVAVAGRVGHIILFNSQPANDIGQWALSLLISSGLFWLIYQFSKGKLIGFGDVRLGLATGSLLATPGRAFMMVFGASVIGTLFALPSVAANKKNLKSQIPYGPFLIIATWLSLLFADPIISWYKNFLN